MMFPTLPSKLQIDELQQYQKEWILILSQQMEDGKKIASFKTDDENIVDNRNSQGKHNNEQSFSG